MNASRIANINSNGINQRTKIWTPKEFLLAQMYYPTGTMSATTVEFVVPTPDARVQVNISVIAVPNPRTPNLSLPVNVLGLTAGGAPQITAGLWLAAAIRAEGGAAIPVTDLVGTDAVRQSIPLNTGLMGWGQTVLADCDVVLGELTMSKVAPGEGSPTNPPETMWMLRTRYQPVAGCVLCDEEWTEIVSKCSPSIRGKPISFITPP